MGNRSEQIWRSCTPHTSGFGFFGLCGKGWLVVFSPLYSLKEQVAELRAKHFRPDWNSSCATPQNLYKRQNMEQMRSLGALGVCSTSSSRGMSPINERFDQEPPWHQNLILAKPSHAFFTKGWFQMRPLNILWLEDDWAVACWVISMESEIDFLQSQGTWLLIPVVLHCSWPSTSPPFVVSSLSLWRTLQILPSPSSAQEGCECWGIIVSSLYNVRVQPHEVVTIFTRTLCHGASVTRHMRNWHLGFTGSLCKKGLDDWRKDAEPASSGVF